MKQLLFILFLLPLSIFTLDNSDELYAVCTEAGWVYKNQDKEEVIKGPFESASHFSDGLGAVRINGLYGYVNSKGKKVIKPKYDFALPFVNGKARVYENGKPIIINKSGEKLFEHNFKQILGFGENDYSIVVTHSRKFGVVDTEGRLVTDTTYSRIAHFQDGVAMATSFEKKVQNSASMPKPLIGLIKWDGKVLVPFGEFERIDKFMNGYSRGHRVVGSGNSKKWVEWILDKNGETLFEIDPKKWTMAYSNILFSNDVAVVDIYHVNVDAIRIFKGSDRYTHAGIIDKQGNILFDNKDFELITPYAENRAFAKTKNGKWLLIDKKGNRLTDTEYDIAESARYKIKEPVFKNGRAKVKVDRNWIYIDTEGEFIGEASVRDKESKQEFFDRLNRYKNPGAVGDAFNVSFIMGGSCTAASGAAEENVSGGWATSSNIPSELKKECNSKETLKLRLTTDEKIGKRLKKCLLTLQLQNCSEDSVQFSAQDSRLNIVLQAKNENGEWKDIEGLRSSWCGNSYHSVTLPPSSLWNFVVRKYEGRFKTKIRAKMYQGKEIIYSNNIDASVNPGQFYIRVGRETKELMPVPRWH